VSTGRQGNDLRQRLYSTQAVVLRRTNFGEADRLLTLYTPDHGKLRAIAKGIRRPSSRKAGHLEPFTHCRVLIARGRNLDIVTQAEAIELHLALRQDLERLAQAYYLVELVDRFAPEGEENPPLFMLLLEALEELGRTKRVDLALRHYELRILSGVGFGVQLFRCTGCGQDIVPERNYFSEASGGVLCPGCGERRAGAREVSLEALKVLRYLGRHSVAASQRLRLGEAVVAEVRRLLRSYITYTLERELRSVKFIGQVEAQVEAQRERARVALA
jgi:DNA repair protein RecO (recombination protein O)